MDKQHYGEYMNIVNFDKYKYAANSKKMWRDGWKEIITSGFHPNINVDDPYTHEQMTHVLAINDNKVLGQISFWIDDFVKYKDLIIGLIYVLPEFRNKGVAKALHNHVLKMCRENSISFISYTVNVDNISMKDFIRKLGPTAYTYTTYQFGVDYGGLNEC